MANPHEMAYVAIYHVDDRVLEALRECMNPSDYRIPKAELERAVENHTGTLGLVGIFECVDPMSVPLESLSEVLPNSVLYLFNKETGRVHLTPTPFFAGPNVTHFFRQ